MAWLRYEYFCQFTYDSELSYEAIIKKEEVLILFIQKTAEEFGAIHLDLNPTRDGLQIQCAFEEMSEDNYSKLCTIIASNMIGGVSGRLLLISRDLQRLQACVASNGTVYQHTLVF